MCLRPPSPVRHCFTNARAFSTRLQIGNWATRNSCAFAFHPLRDSCASCLPFVPFPLLFTLAIGPNRKPGSFALHPLGDTDSPMPVPFPLVFTLAIGPSRSPCAFALHPLGTLIHQCPCLFHTSSHSSHWHLVPIAALAPSPSIPSGPLTRQCPCLSRSSSRWHLGPAATLVPLPSVPVPPL